MKKLLLALPIVAGASWAGTSYYAGVQSETAYDNLLSQLQLMQPLSFEKESYETGLTTSNAVTIVRAVSEKNEKAPVLFRLLHEINHSPVRLEDGSPEVGTATIRTIVSEDSNHPKFKEVRELFKGDEPIELITTVGVGGVVESVANISALEVNHPDKAETLSIDASSFTISVQDEQAKGSGNLGAINILGADGEVIKGSPSNFNAEGMISGSNIFDYEFLWTMDELSIKSENLPDALVFSDISSSVNSEVKGQTLDQTIVFDLKNIDLGAAAPKDASPLTSARLDIAVNNVNVQAMKEYRETVNQFGVAEQIEQSDRFISELYSTITNLITKDVEVDYRLTLGNDGGSADAGFLIRFIGDDSETGRDYIVTAGDALNAIEIEVDVKADKAAVELTPAAGFMYSPQAQMALLDNGDHYLGKGSIKQSVGDLNGQQFPLQEMLGGMLDMPLEALMEMQGL